MATHDRDRGFEPAERKDPGISPGFPSLRVPRRVPWAGLATVISSALIGAAAAWLLISPTPRTPLPRQELAALPSASPVPLPSPSDEPHESRRVKDKSRTSGRPNPGRQPARHTKIVFEPKGGHPGAAPPPPAPPSDPSGSDGSGKDGKRPRDSQKEEPEPEFQWPRTRLYHLYRKRDKLHYYTITATDSQAAQEQNGFKERLSPGYVYTHNAYPKKLIEIHPYALIEPVYIFRVDQGDATFPLYRLYKEGYKQMLTSWTHIRQAWLDKGWQDRGIVGYIYRP